MEWKRSGSPCPLVSMDSVQFPHPEGLDRRRRRFALPPRLRIHTSLHDVIGQLRQRFTGVAELFAVPHPGEVILAGELQVRDLHDHAPFVAPLPRGVENRAQVGGIELPHSAAVCAASGDDARRTGGLSISPSEAHAAEFQGYVSFGHAPSTGSPFWQFPDCRAGCALVPVTFRQY